MSDKQKFENFTNLEKKKKKKKKKHSARHNPISNLFRPNKKKLFPVSCQKFMGPVGRIYIEVYISQRRVNLIKQVFVNISPQRERIFKIT